jgi:O-sialoglycoprotein endopeptidase (EC 3.4.24.57)
MPVLGIETSCDETAVAVYDGRDGLLGHALHSQIALHAEYGGVVPELAARDHVGRIDALAAEALRAAGLTAQALDGIAYTAGPGLIGALLVGAGFAAGLATALECPLIPVHHLEAHVLAAQMLDAPPGFPFVALLVSGGHTLLIEARGLGDYRLLGQTLDDAVGEAFDKSAKLLGLPYPGGPHLARLAASGRPDRFRLPRPLIDRPTLDFSFSGLKTAVAHALPQVTDDTARADLARAFEEAAIDTLTAKCRLAMKTGSARQLVVAGGVGANRRLRERLAAAADADGFALFFPPPELCTDNAAMIAHLGWLRRGEGRDAALGAGAVARWPLDSLRAPTPALNEAQAWT